MENEADFSESASSNAMLQAKRCGSIVKFLIEFTIKPHIKDQGFEEPPYFGSEDLVGAHISVIYSDEMKECGIIDIEEACTPISFKIKRCKIVHLETWKAVDSVFIIEVEAPELDCIRAKYGFPKRKYEFHITIGVKYRDALAA